jgi:putrescine transport system permease protein
MAVTETIAPREKRGWLKWLLVAIPFVWLLVFFLIPFFNVFKMSFSTRARAMPPYKPVLDFADGIAGLWAQLQLFTPANYWTLISQSKYWQSYLSSVQIALISTVLILIVAYPIAYGMARAPRQWRSILVMLVILPFWTSFLIRVYAWIGILGNEGLLNGFLLWTGLIDQPLTILTTNWAVYIGIVYSYLPFMVLPLYATLEKMDETLLEAAADLGCPPIQAFWKITFPLSLPGVVAGCFLVFIPITGEFVIPELLGGSGTMMIGKQLWYEFFNNRNWPLASAVAVVLLLILVVPIVLFQNHQQAAEAGK